MPDSENHTYPDGKPGKSLDSVYIGHIVGLTVKCINSYSHLDFVHYILFELLMVYLGILTMKLDLNK